ncbi:MAG: GFA family protein [Woeseiaceae bacterium]
MKKAYTGSCHCGGVSFRASMDLEDCIVCDCSICAMKAAIMVRIPATDFEMLTPPDQLSEYRFNKKIARHYFCKTCGIYPFHRPRTRPELWGINIRCLEGIRIDKLNPAKVHGSKLD